MLRYTCSIFTAHQKLQGVMVFGSNGIALNLAKKAKKRYQSTLCGRTHSDSITKIRLSPTLWGLSYVGIREWRNLRKGKESFVIKY
jgi:hypothetical protein